MPNCEDCIFYEKLCQHALEEHELKLCKDFKNKAEFVEVVRCKDCEYFRHCNICIFHSEDDYTFATEPDDFCSYGERK